MNWSRNPLKWVWRMDHRSCLLPREVLETLQPFKSHHINYALLNVAHILTVKCVCFIYCWVHSHHTFFSSNSAYTSGVTDLYISVEDLVGALKLKWKPNSMWNFSEYEIRPGNSICRTLECIFRHFWKVTLLLFPRSYILQYWGHWIISGECNMWNLGKQKYSCSSDGQMDIEPWLNHVGSVPFAVFSTCIALFLD